MDSMWMESPTPTQNKNAGKIPDTIVSGKPMNAMNPRVQTTDTPTTITGATTPIKLRNKNMRAKMMTTTDHAPKVCILE